VAAKNLDCAKRMTVWCILAVMLVAVFAIGGYALYVSAGQGPTIQHGLEGTDGLITSRTRYLGGTGW
jgi:hypothetical protein